MSLYNFFKVDKTAYFVKVSARTVASSFYLLNITSLTTLIDLVNIQAGDKSKRKERYSHSGMKDC